MFYRALLTFTVGFFLLPAQAFAGEDFQEKVDRDKLCGQFIGEQQFPALKRLIIKAYQDDETENRTMRLYLGCLKETARSLGQGRLNPSSRGFIAEIHFHAAIAQAFMNEKEMAKASIRAGMEAIGGDQAPVNMFKHIPQMLKEKKKPEDMGILEQALANVQSPPPGYEPPPLHFICHAKGHVVAVDGTKTAKWDYTRPAIVQVLKPAIAQSRSPSPGQVEINHLVGSEYLLGIDTRQEMKELLHRVAANVEPKDTDYPKECKQQEAQVEKEKRDAEREAQRAEADHEKKAAAQAKQEAADEKAAQDRQAQAERDEAARQKEALLWDKQEADRKLRDLEEKKKLEKQAEKAREKNEKKAKQKAKQDQKKKKDKDKQDGGDEWKKAQDKQDLSPSPFN